MKNKYIILFIIIFVLFALGSCSTKTVTIGEEMNGRKIAVKQGQTLLLRIDGNPTTGYQWVVDELDESILALSDDPDYKSDSMLIGSGGTYTFKFNTVNLGETTLRLKYYRDFEKDIPPAVYFEVHVTVE